MTANLMQCDPQAFVVQLSRREKQIMIRQDCPYIDGTTPRVVCRMHYIQKTKYPFVYLCSLTIVDHCAMRDSRH